MSVNKRPALRVDDVGMHAACCGTNTWQAKIRYVADRPCTHRAALENYAGVAHSAESLDSTTPEQNGQPIDYNLLAMPGQGRLGDRAYVPRDEHGCPFCPHPGTGPAISGSATVSVNKRPALRVDDVGMHAACCGTNTWQAKTGSETVFIDNKPAHRLTDRTKHCGGDGQLIEGSPNVIVGDTSASPAALPRIVSSSGDASSSNGASSGSAGSSRSGISSSDDASSRDGASSHGESNAAAAQDSDARLAADPTDIIEPGIDPDPATLHAQAQADVLRAAAEAHIPFCEECERTGAGSRP